MNNQHIPLKPRTVNDLVASLRRAWNWAITSGLIQSMNPFNMRPLPRVHSGHRLMTEDDFKRLLRAANANFRRVLFTLRFTSLRPHELRNLEWSMIDWRLNCFIIHKHESSPAKYHTPRVVPFPPFVGKLLMWLQREHGNSSPHVFLQPDGGHWNNSLRLSWWMSRTRRRAGIALDENGVPLVLHSTVRTYITAAATLGIERTILRALAGYANPRTGGFMPHMTIQTLLRAANRVADALKLKRTPRVPQQPNGQSPKQ